MLSFDISRSPVILLTGLMAAVVASGLSVKCFIDLLRKRHTRFNGSLARTIESIPVVAGIMPLSGFLSMFFTMIKIMLISPTATSGTGDPRVVSGGIAEEIAIIIYPLGLFLFFYCVWLVLRVIHDHRRVTETNISHP